MDIQKVNQSKTEYKVVELVDTDKVSQKSQSDLVELAREIQKADNFTHSTACSKLQVILEQIKFLQHQARKVLEEAKNSDNLHHIACNFKKVPGHTYYLYQRPSGQKYFSLLSPEEWGASCPHTFINAYRLELDFSWTPTSQIEGKDFELNTLHRILSKNKALSVTFEAVDNPVEQNYVVWEPESNDIHKGSF